MFVSVTITPQYLGLKPEVITKISYDEELWSHELLICQVVPANMGKTCSHRCKLIYQSELHVAPVSMIGHQRFRSYYG